MSNFELKFVLKKLFLLFLIFRLHSKTLSAKIYNVLGLFR